ncbi:hypothetical protein BRADI_1g03355v3 [Brachypodium distachyon]|uniref:Uncharacterized protein n=1 Tax=Brachypodium distachyon TaxID=15368 RepID=A0A2K2DHW9_BRADI|nr:hypothetical protein BRADI_1g03355v3 [Brachypodium distachyon]
MLKGRWEMPLDGMKGLGEDAKGKKGLMAVEVRVNAGAASGRGGGGGGRGIAGVRRKGPRSRAGGGAEELGGATRAAEPIFAARVWTVEGGRKTIVGVKLKAFAQKKVIRGHGSWAHVSEHRYRAQWLLHHVCLAVLLATRVKRQAAAGVGSNQWQRGARTASCGYSGAVEAGDGGAGKSTAVPGSRSKEELHRWLPLGVSDFNFVMFLCKTVH